MKKMLFLISLVLTVATLAAQDLATQAAAANERYAQGLYSEAIEGYESVLQQGYCSPALYYNLANAYYRDDQLGKAILNYHRALRLAPHMDDARQDLALAESHTTDRITPLPQFFLTRWVDALAKALSLRGWRVVLLLFTALLALCILGLRLGHKRSLRKASLLAGLAILVLWLFFLWIMLRATRQYNAHSEAIVTAQSVSIKSSPTEQGTDVMILHEGTAVGVTDSLTGWYRIHLADGFTGWVPSSEIERI